MYTLKKIFRSRREEGVERELLLLLLFLQFFCDVAGP